MKDRKNHEPATAPGQTNMPAKEMEEVSVGRKNEDAQRNNQQEVKEDAGSIPLDHDETIGIP